VVRQKVAEILTDPVAWSVDRSPKICRGDLAWMIPTEWLENSRAQGPDNDSWCHGTYLIAGIPSPSLVSFFFLNPSCWEGGQATDVTTVIQLLLTSRIPLSRVSTSLNILSCRKTEDVHGLPVGGLPLSALVSGSHFHWSDLRVFFLILYPLLAVARWRLHQSNCWPANAPQPLVVVFYWLGKGPAGVLWMWELVRYNFF